MAPSLATIYSGELEGIHANVVEVEVDLQVGLHSFMIVGLADKAVSEAKERVSGALKNSGAKPPNRENRKITVNLAPANVRKTGAHYDLAIAIGYLLATKQMRQFAAEKILFAGELALSGQLRSIRGALSIALLAQNLGFTTVVVPRENGNEAGCVRNVRIVAAETLKEVIAIFEGRSEPASGQINNETLSAFPSTISSAPDFSTIIGQHHAKRALTIAVAGNHNVLLVGPPGVGKSALCTALPSIMPPLEEPKAIEVTQIYSAAGHFPKSLSTTAPFRAPHHTASLSAMIGGTARPGEITLAHHGVLFLDELPEFHRDVLESLRGPLESGIIQLARLHGHITMPATFLLIAAMNPCPCGYSGDQEKKCRCTERDILKYKKKLSGPLLDRIDLQISVSRVKSSELAAAPQRRPESEPIRSLVTSARAWAREHRPSQQPIFTKAGEKMLALLHEQNLSARSYYKVLRVARTIADLEKTEAVSDAHLAEAFSYRFR